MSCVKNWPLCNQGYPYPMRIFHEFSIENFCKHSNCKWRLEIGINCYFYMRFGHWLSTFIWGHLSHTVTQFFFYFFLHAKMCQKNTFSLHWGPKICFSLHLRSGCPKHRTFFAQLKARFYGHMRDAEGLPSLCKRGLKPLTIKWNEHISCHFELYTLYPCVA